MQSVTKEQCNQAEQKKQAHTSVDLAVAGALQPRDQPTVASGPIWPQPVFIYPLN